MFQEIVFSEMDRIAVIAPHPDDECIGAAGVLLKAPEKTDIYVLTDGSHGSSKRTVEEERVVRKKQFEAEMEYLNPHAWYWFGFEDTKLKEQRADAVEIDFTKYTKIFLPELDSQHPDHTAAAQICCDLIRRQGADAECFLYEVSMLFHYPSHYIDITGMEEEKRRLIRFHEDQPNQERITMSRNAYRAAQTTRRDFKCVECYKHIDVCAGPDSATYGGNLMDRDKEKCVVVIDETLPIGMAANTAAILGLTIGSEEPSMIGPVVKDGAGREHLGITIAPIPVLKGSRAVMMDLRNKLYDSEYADVKVVDFSETASYSNSYSDYAERLAEQSGDGIRYIGLGLIGPKKKINRLTGGLPLLK